MSAFHVIAAVPLCRIGYFVADMIESFELWPWSNGTSRQVSPKAAVLTNRERATEFAPKRTLGDRKHGFSGMLEFSQLN